MTMANQIGLKRSWFQDKKCFPHYDLRSSKRGLAIAFGAREVTRQWMGRRLLKDLAGALYFCNHCYMEFHAPSRPAMCPGCSSQDFNEIAVSHYKEPSCRPSVKSKS